jgi:hypothetical protein
MTGLRVQRTEEIKKAILIDELIFDKKGHTLGFI